MNIKNTKIGTRLRFFSRVVTVYMAKRGFEPFLESKNLFDEMFSMGSKLSKTCLPVGSLENIVGC